MWSLIELSSLVSLSSLFSLCSLSSQRLLVALGRLVSLGWFILLGRLVSLGRLVLIGPLVLIGQLVSLGRLDLLGKLNSLGRLVSVSVAFENQKDCAGCSLSGSRPRVSWIRLWLDAPTLWSYDRPTLAHRCTIFLCHLGCEIDDRHKYLMSNNRNHLVGWLTRPTLAIILFSWAMILFSTRPTNSIVVLW